MFSINTPKINVTFPATDGKPKVASVRFPTDDEWILRSRRRKVITRNLGRGRTQSDTIGAEEVDLEIYAAIRLEGSCDLDGAECMQLLDRVGSCEVLDYEHEGNGVAVSLLLPGDTEATHRLRVPTAKEVLDYNRGLAKVTTLSNGRDQIAIDITAAGRLWDALRLDHTGYDGPVPIVHKVHAIRAAVEASENMVFDEGPSANF